MKLHIKKVLSLVLCLCMMLSVMSLAIPAFAAETDNIVALRPLTSLEKGLRLQRKHLQEVQVTSNDIPEGTITNIEDVLGKYLTTNVVAGEYITSAKISEKSPFAGMTSDDPSSNANGQNYLVVTDYVKMGIDMSAQVQKLIDENPNRTLYFPDGGYQFSKPITIPADPAKSVSFKLSNYAVFSPSATYSSEDSSDGLLRIGVGDVSSNNADGVGSFISVTGGIFSMSSQKSGAAISVEGGNNVVLTNLCVRSAKIGIVIKSNNVDVDNVVLTGQGVESTAIKISGNENTVSNVRVVDIGIGVHLTKGKNILRNVHPLGSKLVNTAKAFFDESDGNLYDYCYSDQFAYGFYLKANNRSIFNNCFAYWYAESATHYGFYQEGDFNSIIRNSRVDFGMRGDDAAYIVVTGSGGSGKIINHNHNSLGSDNHSGEFNRYKA